MKILNRLQQVNWLADFLAPLALIFMEAAWIYPWLAFIGKWDILLAQRHILSLLSVLLLIGSGYTLTRFFNSRNRSGPLARFLIVTIGLVIIFFTIRLEYSIGFPLTNSNWFIRFGRIMLDIFNNLHPVAMAIPVSFFLYWRGIRRAQTPLFFQNIYPSFLVGLAALVLLSIFWGAGAARADIIDLLGEIGIYIAGFFFFGLTALALTNLHNIRMRLKKRDGTQATFNRRWLTIVMGIIAGLVLFGVVIASAFSSQFIRFVSSAAGFIWNIVERVAYYIFLPISYLVGLLLIFLKWLIELIRNKQETSPAENFEPGENPEFPEFVSRSLSPETLLILKWIFFGLIISLLVFLLVRAILRSRAAQKGDDILEEHESLWTWAGFKDDLKQWLKSIKLRRTGKARVTDTEPGADDESGGILGIREMYGRFLWYLYHLGLPRNRHETPFEYEKRITPVFPDKKHMVSDITGYYVNLRYGDIEAGQQELVNANTTWLSLHHELSRLLKERQTNTPRQPQ